MNGLILEGGGTRGAYQIGAYQALVDCNVKISGVCGTSIGSFNAAMIVAGDFEKLKKFWTQENLGALLGFKELESEEEMSAIKELMIPIKHYITNRGISLDSLRTRIEKLIDEDKIRNNNLDYGLVTYRLSDQKLLYLYKEDIPRGKLVDYICASCYLPVFKFEKLDGESYYLDGGFYDASPSNMLTSKNYKKVYIVELKALGVNAKKNNGNTKIIKISPSRPLGNILNTNKTNIKNNIEMGYYDTLKVLKKLDGYKFVFAKKPKWFYNILSRKVSSRTRKRVETFFFTIDSKTLIIKSIEYILLREKKPYNQIYNVNKEIKRIKESQETLIVYKYIKELKIF